MRKIMLVLALLTSAVFVGGAAAGHHPSDYWTLSLSAHPTTITSGEHVDLSGVLVNNGTDGVGNQEVVLRTYASGSCSGTPSGSDNVTTSNPSHGAKGEYGKTVSPSVGTWSFKAEATGHGSGQYAVSGCVTVTVDPKADAWTITLAANPTAIAAGESSELTGLLTKISDHQAQGDQNVVVREYGGATCSGSAVKSTALKTARYGSGKGTYGVSFDGSVAGTFSFRAEATGSHDGDHALSGCAAVTVNAADTGNGGGDETTTTLDPIVDPAADPVVVVDPVVAPLVAPVVAQSGGIGVFLCYSTFGTDTMPMHMQIGDAFEAIASGQFSYWSPAIAESGNVEHGTNVGAYHLVCNPPSNLTDTGVDVDGGGNLYVDHGAAWREAWVDSTLGLYEIYG